MSQRTYDTKYIIKCANRIKKLADKLDTKVKLPDIGRSKGSGIEMLKKAAHDLETEKIALKEIMLKSARYFDNTASSIDKKDKTDSAKIR